MKQILTQQDFDTDMDGDPDEWASYHPIRKLFDNHRQKSERSEKGKPDLIDLFEPEDEP